MRAHLDKEVGGASTLARGVHLLRQPVDARTVAHAYDDSRVALLLEVGHRLPEEDVELLGDA
eukprot:5276499-Prymnesium_polylepis.1